MIGEAVGIGYSLEACLLNNPVKIVIAQGGIIVKAVISTRYRTIYLLHKGCWVFYFLAPVGVDMPLIV